MMESSVPEIKHSLDTGEGRAELIKRAAIMGLPNITAGKYACHCQYIYDNMDPKYKESMKCAHTVIVKYFMTSDISLPNANNVLDIDMGYDGAWMTRGHKSHVSDH